MGGTATPQSEKKGFTIGILLTFILAIAAKYIAMLPFFSIMGHLVIAILLGMIWQGFSRVPHRSLSGIQFSSKKLLRLGIILLGMRLNLVDIVEAGPKVLLLATIVICFTLPVVYGFSRLLKADQKLSILTACGTAICGAAAVVAISPQIKAKEEETAISAAVVAILGTIFTLLYTFLYPVLGLSSEGYGVFSGATLHEIAHVIAAAAPGGDSAVDIAVIVKLTRVLLLVPVALIIGFWYNRLEGKKAAEGYDNNKRQSLPIPWFIFGFLVMSAIHSTGLIPEVVASWMVDIAYLLIAMAMAGLGLQVQFAAFRKTGMPALVAGLLGSVLLAIIGYVLTFALQLA
ncbi:YeiH family protein [Brevibacillus daliensis]|uniref:YeiH family protein n=1 Tax=Brevibacillus daliensis TaxID=2892995 RepID=UPI001E4FCC31|nr:YeiH family protein [Brevibacillus daliensis]